MRRKTRAPDQESIHYNWEHPIGQSDPSRTPTSSLPEGPQPLRRSPNSPGSLPLTRPTTQHSQCPRGPGHTGLSSGLGHTWRLGTFVRAVLSSWSIYPTPNPSPSYLQPTCQVSDEMSPPWGTLLCLFYLMTAHTLAQGPRLVPQSASHDATCLPSHRGLHMMTRGLHYVRMSQTDKTAILGKSS